MDTIIKIAEEQGMKLLGGIIVLAVGFFLVRWVMKFLTRNNHLTKLEPTVKGCLVDDLRRLIDVWKLNGREMRRVVRVLYDFVDVEQFGELLERMGQ